MEELKKIIEKNQAVLDDIDKRLSRIERRFTWNTIFGFIKAAVIIAPIVAGIIYLSPFFRRYVDSIKPLFNGLAVKSENSNTTASPIINLDLFSPQVRELFCNQEIREALVEKNCQ